MKIFGSLASIFLLSVILSLLGYSSVLQDQMQYVGNELTHGNEEISNVIYSFRKYFLISSVVLLAVVMLSITIWSNKTTFNAYNLRKNKARKLEFYAIYINM